MRFKDIEIKTIQEELSRSLMPEEKILRPFKLKSDYIVFTSLRIIIVGKKVARIREFLSVPYKSINFWGARSKGRFNMDGDIVINVTGMDNEIKLDFKKKEVVYDVQRILATYVR